MLSAADTTYKPDVTAVLSRLTFQSAKGCRAISNSAEADINRLQNSACLKVLGAGRPCELCVLSQSKLPSSSAQCAPAYYGRV